MKRHAIALLAILAAGAAACQLLVGIEDRGHAAPSEDASLDAPLEAEASAPERCHTEHAPPKLGSAAPGSSDVTLLTAVVALDPSQGQVGLDLDGVCTCSPDPGSCKTTGAKEHCDTDGGVDNTGAPLFKKLVALSVGNANTVNNLIDIGQLGFVIRVTGYNGFEDDDEVEISTFVSHGTPLDDAGVPTAPSRDGGVLAYTIDPTTTLTPDAASPETSPFARARGFVRQHRLILTDSRIVVGLGALSMTLTNAVLMATIKPQNGAYALEDGVMTGRLETKDVLFSLGAFAIQSVPVCPGTATYEGLKAVICNAQDVSSDPKKDNTGTDCDAISVGITFEARPTKVTGVRSRDVLPGRGCDLDASFSCP
ncbi:MAG: hypothetical protein JWM74_2946 [Myxococcaceae bacterium]|nr:hypothetical protein [Myxococcaceae bacterium]